MTTKEKVVLGLDFGGTKLAAGTIDLEQETLLDAKQMPTRVNFGAEGAVADMIAMARELVGIERIEAIGVSFGGHVLSNRVLRSLHVAGWSDFPLEERLAEQFGVSTVRIANDANAVALGEWRYGSGQGAHSMLYITVSTGIGGGVVVDGGLLEGVNGMAGEIGHMKMVPNGPRCSCGFYGCLESVAAGPAIVNYTQAAMVAQPTLQTSLRTAETLTTKFIAARAECGDVLAKQAMERSGHFVGLAIANSVNLVDVERVVIGGGISRSGSVWWEVLRNTIESNTLPWNRSVDVQRSKLGSYEGVWGACALFDSG